MFDVTKRTVLVTGATSGLGLEAAAQFAAAGYREVVVTGRTGDKAEAARDGLRAAQLHVIEMNHLANPTAQRALWRVTAEITGVDRPTQHGDDPAQHNPRGTP